MEQQLAYDISPEQRDGEAFGDYLERIKCYKFYGSSISLHHKEGIQYPLEWLQKAYGGNRKAQGIALLRGLLPAMERQIPGLDQVTIEYEGSGDSGQIDFIGYRAGVEKASFDQLPHEQAKIIEELLDVVGWDIAYGTNPGFEINEGGQGTLTCQKDQDEGVWTLSLHHEANIIQVDVEEFDL